MAEPKPSWLDEVAPDMVGAAAKVWTFAPPPPSDDPRHATTIGDSYLIFAPAAHPFWAWHVLMGVALRDTPGVEPAKRQYPEAEYELLVLALDPARPTPDPRVWPLPGLPMLQPPDAVVQFHGTGDENAATLLKLCARAVADGVLVPDSDHRGNWVRTVTASAEHFHPGGHRASGGDPC